MTLVLEDGDLPAAVQAHELVGAMVAAANAKAKRVAPCLFWTGDPETDPDTETPAPSEDQLAEAKLVLIGMVTRWADAGSGALATKTAGPFGESIDTRQKTGFNPWPSEITALQDICKGDEDSSGAFAVDTVSCAPLHSPICSLYFGGTSCSCGADISGFPLYENVP